MKNLFLSPALLTLFLLLGMPGCGHKITLDPPPPDQLETVHKFRADLGCGNIIFKWSPVFFDSKGEALEEPAKYLLLRRRGEPVKFPEPTSTPLTETDSEFTPAPEITPTPLPADSETGETTPTPGKETEAALLERISPEYEYKLIAIVDGLSGEISSNQLEDAWLTYTDDGAPGVMVAPRQDGKFKLTEKFPPEKTELDIDLVPNTTYYYKVFAVSAKGILSPASYTVEVPFIMIPKAPELIETEVESGKIRLRWAPPETNCDDSPVSHLSGIFISRSESTDKDSFSVIATLGNPDQTEFEDIAIESDRIYYYKLQYFVNPLKVPGILSDPIAVNTADTFPPEPPYNLKTAASTLGVHLAWESHSEPDLAGFRIYRGDSIEGPFQVISGEALLTDTVFTDNAVESGKYYVYKIAAVDGSRNANVSEPSDPATIIVP